MNTGLLVSRLLPSLMRCTARMLLPALLGWGLLASAVQAQADALTQTQTLVPAITSTLVPASAPAALDLVSSNSALAPHIRLPFRVITGLKANAGPEQALVALAGAQPFEPERVYELSSDTSMWLILRVQTDPLSQKRWVLNFVNTFLDRVELHAINAQGVWQSEAAGDNVAHSQWSQRTLAPQVLLPVMPAGEREVLIKIVHGFAQQIPVQLMEQQQAEQANRDSFLLAGLLVGLLGVVLLLSLHLAVSYRDNAYVWYALYTLLAILASCSYLGLTSYLLWPDATHWPEYSILFLIHASVTAQLWFCQVMFLRDGPWGLLRKITYGAVGLSVVLGLVYFFLPTATQRMVIFALSQVICVGMIFFIVGLTLRRTKQKAAYFWVIAYVPLIGAVVLALLRHFTWITGFDLPYELPIYPLVFEALVLLAALHMHAKDRHAVQVKARAVAELDPLTGFLNSGTFSAQIKQLWEKSLRQRDDFSLALIQVQHTTDRSDSQSALKLEKKMLRTVRLLRALMREVDMVGRIGGNTFALAMPGIPMGDELNNRLSRLVAQGLMRDVYDTDATELRFRIAAGSRLTFGDSLSALDNTLRGEISQSLGWSRKPIHYITPSSIPGELSAGNWEAQVDPSVKGTADSAAMSSGASSRPASSGPASSGPASSGPASSGPASSAPNSSRPK
jgi:two-component system, sensor histidine kinase LadS